LVNQTETFYPGNGIRAAKVTAPDGTYTLTTNEFGRTVSVTRCTSNGAQLSQVLYYYDVYGRQQYVADARNGTNSFEYDNLDRVESFTTPAPGTGADPQTTSYEYDKLGRVIATSLPDGGSLYKSYAASGELLSTHGSREYPVAYTYDSQGRMQTMKTWQQFGNEATAAVTVWTNDSQRGWLNNKRYADDEGPDYLYTKAGRLQQRTWARGTTTTYTTKGAGDVEYIEYSDGTGNVTNVYDRLGRVTAVYSGTNITTRLYSDSGLLLSETQDGIIVSNRYDELQRRTNVAVVIGGTAVASTGYSYDSAGRLSTVTDGTISATYSYVANSPLVSQILFTNTSTGAGMTTTKSYDFLNRLVAITNAPSADSPVVFNYAYNQANQRIAITNAEGGHWAYTYDSLGQVTSGRKSWSDGTRVLGQQFEYTFDDIGNRKTAVSGGDENSRNKRTQTYSANSLNQYTNRTVPGYVNILGEATNIATVTVNSVPTSRKNDYYRAEVSVLNNGAAVWQPITNTAVLASGTNDYVTNWTGNVFVPQTPESFLHDLDGNLTNDGRWILTWDAENRLVSMTSHEDAASGSRLSLHFGYDSQSRRVSKVVSNWTGSAWSKQSDIRFVYDRWNLLAELNATNNAIINSFMWGLDLSGSIQGAGGVGGLLALTTTNAGTHFVGCDGNGNVSALVNASSGTTTANYEYDPFGTVLRATGPMALLNPIRFSTKYSDTETRIIYYGYRFYNPAFGNWLSRDPVGELGGLNLNNFAGVDLINAIDPFGLYKRKGRRIFVEPCEIVIVYGHGKPNDPFTFEFSSACSAGGVVTCWPGRSNTNIPVENRIPNAPSHDEMITWPGSMETDAATLILEEDVLPNGQVELDDTIRGAIAKAKSLNCCSTVTIRFIRIKKLWYNPQVPTLEEIEVGPPIFSPPLQRR
jgi:RHS repeat-associated protein